MKKRILEVKKWKKYLGASCYQYAINFYSNEFLLVGDIIGKRCNEYSSDETLIETLREELEVLSYEITETETYTPLEKHETKIYLQRDQNSGYYHFLKQDNNGIWSHKYPNEMPTTLINGKKLINPDLITKPPIYGRCFCLRKS